MYKAIKVKNVFDEMYYAEVQPVSMMYTSTSFQNLVSAQVLENLPNTVRENYLPNLYQESYKNESLKSNEGISIFFDKNEETVKFVGTLDYSNDPAGEKFEGLRFAYLYSVNSKKLIISEIELVIVSNELAHKDIETKAPEEIAKFMKKHNLTEEDLTGYQ
ncbi:TipC family immunity protein, partial [Pueribacillus sp. YX66]|uniref:TipC family immunity protein n=1 Tax=Pueribacillus sp. YX66 TaxID=3229242 RepID=UPI00358D17DC